MNHFLINVHQDSTAISESTKRYCWLESLFGRRFPYIVNNDCRADSRNQLFPYLRFLDAAMTGGKGFAAHSSLFRCINQSATSSHRHKSTCKQPAGGFRASQLILVSENSI